MQNIKEALDNPAEFDEFKKKNPKMNRNFDNKKYGKYFDINGQIIPDLKDEYFKLLKSEGSPMSENIVKESAGGVKLHVEFYPYERYGGDGRKRKANVSAPDMLTALKKMVDRMGLYLTSEEIEEEGYTPEEIINEIQMSNGDGCDYISLLQEVNSGDILIQGDYEDEDEDWDESLEVNEKERETLGEDLENLEITDTTTVVNQPTGVAKEESREFEDRYEEANKVPEDAPLFGAKDQPVPDDVVEPKLTLEEDLFNQSSAEGLSEDLIYGKSSLDDYLDVIKKYYRGLNSDMLIDSIFLGLPDDLAYEAAVTIGEMVEDALDESLDEGKSIAEGQDLDDIKALFAGFIDESDIDQIFKAGK